MIKFNELINKRMKFMKIGVLGYASVGKNLEVLFKNAGYTTIIGVRSPEKYEQDNALYDILPSLREKMNAPTKNNK